MKRLHLCGLLVLCLARGAAAGSPSLFENNLVLTNRININAAIFVNNRTIFFDLESLGTVDTAVFQTTGTSYYTNSLYAGMLSQPGFSFETVNGTGIHPAVSFDNFGTIVAMDAQVMGFFTAGGVSPPILVPPSPTLEPGYNAAVGSQLSVWATRISNNGTLFCGDSGVVQLTGTTLNLAGGIGAGSVSETDPYAIMSRGIVAAVSTNGTIYPFYAPAASEFPICWGVTNGATSTNNVQTLATDLAYMASNLAYFVELPYPVLASRNSMLDGVLLTQYPAPGAFPEYIFPLSSVVQVSAAAPAPAPPAVTPNFVPYVYSYTVASGGSNGPLDYYYNVILVNSAFVDAGITVQAGFLTNSGEEIALGPEQNIMTNADLNAMELIVRFSEPVTDVLTGQTVNNSIYVLDSMGIQLAAVEAINNIFPFENRPLGIEITRSEPVEWQYAFAANATFDPSVLYASNAATGVTRFNSTTAPMNSLFYATMVGRNPEKRNGLFPYTETLVGTTNTGFSDYTNEGGQLMIKATTANLSNLNYRANSFLTLNVPNLTGTPSGPDCGNMELTLGTAKNPLVISNLLPASFDRLRGDIAVLSFTWTNLETNASIGGFGQGGGGGPGGGGGSGGATNAPQPAVTNNWHYHVMIVDQDLRGSFQPTALDAILSGSKMVLQDPMRVVGSLWIGATNLTVNNNLSLSDSAGTLRSANVPQLKSLLVGPNGTIQADSEMSLGAALGVKQVPTAQNTSILSITNQGAMITGVAEIQSRLFANEGTFLVTNGGELFLNSMTNFLGGGSIGASNSLAAGSSIYLSSTSIQVTNSQIRAGQSMNGQLVLRATGELTDHYPGTTSTNAYATNDWQVTGGFSMSVKPASGNLFATQIATIASNSGQTIVHVWAGKDLGATAAGFVNNEVIGHLILDRTTNAVLQFSAAGKSNAMYVDYLELRDLAYSQYNQGLVLDPNFKIYYANANLDPIKIHRVYPNLIWVTNFTGPNSTTNMEVITPGGTNSFAVNVLLSSSQEFSTFVSGTANAGVHFPIIYSNTSPNPVPSPASVTSTTNVPVSNTNGVFGQTFVIWTTGQGHVTAGGSLAGLQAGQKLSLTAVPASNWLFAGWSWPGPVGATNITNAAITFQVPTNAFSFVTANFVTNPLAGFAGSYYGLFTNTNGVTLRNSGFVTFTLNSQAVFSGKLSLGTNTYPFSSQFYDTNSATAVATNGTNRLLVSLQISGSAAPGQATGSVSNAAFDSILTAYQAPVWTASNSAPQAGSYTLVLTNANAATRPGGDSYGTVTVGSNGNLSAVVTLADNASSSQAVPLSENGLWPLFFAPSGVAQSLLGWVAFDTNGAGGTPAGMTGSVTWVKAAGAGTYYTNGFTNNSILLGSAYSAAWQRTNGLGLTNPSVMLTGGNLAAATNVPVTANGLESYTNKTTLTLTINPATGLFSGQYAPAKGKAIPLAGAVLQNGRGAGGFFLGTNQSGAVWLQGN